MYELLILKLLIRHPKHGYLIAKIINDIIGPYARVSNGRLYPLLAKLEEAGLVRLENDKPSHELAALAEASRPVHTYHITEAGKQRFHDLMMDTTSNPGEYKRLFPLKVSSFGYIKPEEQVQLIEHYLHYSQAHIMHLKAASDDMCKNHLEYLEKTGDIDNVLEFMYHQINQWQLELDWAKQLREKALTGLANNSKSETDSLAKV